MKGKRIGYIRVSSPDQNPDRQLEGIELDKKFVDTASGKDVRRPKLDELLNYVREDDIVIVHSMDRLARTIDSLRKIVRDLNSQKVQVQFIKENLIFTGDDSPMSNLLLTIIGGIAEFERSWIRERQAEGIAIAKAKGVYKGSKPALDPAKIIELDKQLNTGISKAKIARALNVTRSSIYRYMRSLKQQSI